MAPDIGFLANSGFSPETLAHASEQASRANIPASEWIIHRGLISRPDYVEAIGRHMGIAFARHGPRSDEITGVSGEIETYGSGCHALGIRRAARTGKGQDKQLYIAPVEGEASACLAGLRRMPNLENVILTPPDALRLAIHRAQNRSWIRQASTSLKTILPEYCASARLSAAQAIWLTAVICLFGAGLTFAARPTFDALCLFLSFFYTATILVRTYITARLDEIEPGGHRPLPVANPEDYPDYSIIVALHDEAGQVESLVGALSRMEWPRSKLEVFFVCEQADRTTIAALREIELPQGFHLIICPPGLPRTKPRALNYVLPLCRGSFTVIYDAEDRPDPGQLREAWQAFDHDRSGGLACVQAPLRVYNRKQNWLTRLFAIEYDTLFLGMLPVLARIGAPMPLGGTSNHFRTKALRDAGGWDPFNVTEDADLGIRLSRMGYRCGTITRPTWEEAPPKLLIWIRQRTRWLKGWLQTILVHMRNPLRTHRELGLRGNLFFHLVLTAIVISMMVHPLYFVLTGYQLYTLGSEKPSLTQSAWLGLSMFNLAAGYLTYGVLARVVMIRNRIAGETLVLFTFPLYWLMISIAGWRALLQLFVRPFKWEKTAHGLAKIPSSHNMNDMKDVILAD